MLSLQFYFGQPLLLAGFQISTGELFVGALLTLAGVSAVVFGSKFYLSTQAQRLELAENDPLQRKNENVQTEKHRITFFLVGASSALMLVFLAMNWTTFSRQIDIIADLGEPETINIDIPNTSIPVAPPPAEAPKPPLELAQDFKIEDREIVENPEQKPVEQQVTEFGNGDMGSQGVTGGQAGGTGTSPMPLIDVEPDDKDDEREIFSVVEKMPRLAVCEQDANLDDAAKKTCADRFLLTYLAENMRYPSMAKDLGIEGMAVISFVVERDGTLTDMKISRKLGGGCEEEALRVVKKMASEYKWIPGTQRTRPVRVKFNLPVRFKLK